LKHKYDSMCQNGQFPTTIIIIIMITTTIIIIYLFRGYQKD